MWTRCDHFVYDLGIVVVTMTNCGSPCASIEEAPLPNKSQTRSRRYLPPLPSRHEMESFTWSPNHSNRESSRPERHFQERQEGGRYFYFRAINSLTKRGTLICLMSKRKHGWKCDTRFVAPSDCTQNMKANTYSEDPTICLSVLLIV